MKTKNNASRLIRLFSLAAIALFAAFQVNAQSVKKTFSYELTLKGSSNIHDWNMKSSGSNLEAVFNFDQSTKQLLGIAPLTFNMPVKNLKSSEGLLNSRAYDALNADKFPNITFKLISATPQGAQMKLVGQLTVAGTTKDVTLVANAQKAANGAQVLTGSQKMKITDFGLKPPKYMMGVMKVYDDLTVDYTVRF